MVVYAENDSKQASAARGRNLSGADVMIWTVMNMRRSVKIMRLIDADKLKYAIHCAYSDDLEILEKIDEQPTAFDVDKIAKQLKDLKAMYWFSIANTGDEKLDVAYENVGNALDRAIEIVEGGGVE